MLGFKGKPVSQRKQICAAINSAHLIQFNYGNGLRAKLSVVEPYCYGRLSGKEESLLAYQVSGYAELDVPVGWKLYRPELMNDLAVANERFAGRKVSPGYDTRRSCFAEVYAEIPLQGNDEEKTEPKPEPLPHNELVKRFRLGHWLSRSKE